jgi:hypothetical protein
VTLDHALSSNDGTSAPVSVLLAMNLQLSWRGTRVRAVGGTGTLVSGAVVESSPASDPPLPEPPLLLPLPLPLLAPLLEPLLDVLPSTPPLLLAPELPLEEPVLPSGLGCAPPPVSPEPQLQGAQRRISARQRIAHFA